MVVAAAAAKAAKTTAADRALKRSKARGEIRQMLIETQSAGQVKISRERGRQRRSVVKAQNVQRVLERQGSEAARTQGYAERAEIARQQRAASGEQRVETQKELAGLARKQKVISSATGSVTGSSIWSTITLLVTLWFVMVIIYIIVRNGEAFGGFAGGVGSFIQGLSSDKPLFVATATESQ